MDNNSTDQPEDVLSSYIALGIVDFRTCLGFALQVPFYNHILGTVRKRSTWMATIDVDEFLVPVGYRSVIDVLRNLQWAAGVRVNWLVFGSNGLITQTEGLVIERFRNHTEWSFRLNRAGKEIGNSQSLVRFRCHFHVYARGMVVNPKGKKCFPDVARHQPCHANLRIHHYLTKSLDELARKRKRGTALRYVSDAKIQHIVDKVAEEILEYPDTVTSDTAIDWAIPLVKQRIAKRKETEKNVWPRLDASKEKGRCPFQ
jgi:hypothetical protein